MFSIKPAISKKIAGFTGSMLDDFYNKIRAIQEFNIEFEALFIISENQEYLIGLLKDQLALGEDKSGKPVTVFDKPYYSQRTLREKRLMDGLSGQTKWITNYMTGAFYGNLKVITSGREFTFSSDVSYFDSIIYQSGDDIIELSQEHLKQFSDQVFMPLIKEAFENNFNGL